MLTEQSRHLAHTYGPRRSGRGWRLRVGFGNSSDSVENLLSVHLPSVRSPTRARISTTQDRSRTNSSTQQDPPTPPSPVALTRGPVVWSFRSKYSSSFAPPPDGMTERENCVQQNQCNRADKTGSLTDRTLRLSEGRGIQLLTCTYAFGRLDRYCWQPYSYVTAWCRLWSADPTFS